MITLNFASASRDFNSPNASSYGIPLLFYTGVALVLPLTPVEVSDAQISHQNAVIEMICDLRSIIKVDFSAIRGICMAKASINREHRTQGRCFVYPGKHTIRFEDRSLRGLNVDELRNDQEKDD